MSKNEIYDLQLSLSGNNLAFCFNKIQITYAVLYVAVT